MIEDIKRQTAIAKQKAEIAKLKAEKALLKNDMQEPKPADHHEAEVFQESAQRISNIIKDLEQELHSHKDAKEKKEPEPVIDGKDGMETIKQYFSGEEGLKRSNAFIKFVGMLTSTEQVEKPEPKEEKKEETPHIVVNMPPEAP